MRIFETGSGANIIASNYIGTALDGASDLGNSLSGVLLSNSPNNNIDGNVISGNDEFGVYLLGVDSTGNTVQGNHIGTDATGLNPVGNAGSGVVISNASQNLIGGTTPESRNVISGNLRSGVYLIRDGATANRVEGNYIGTNATGTKDLGNRLSGVVIQGAANNTIGGTVSGTGNTIANNGLSGIRVLDNQAIDNAIHRNSIVSNIGLGIDLAGDGATVNDTNDADMGPNRLQNTATTLEIEVTETGTTALIDFEYQVDTLPDNATFPLTVEFFLSDSNGQGIHYLTDNLYSTTDQTVGLKPFSQSFLVSSFPFTPEYGSATVTDAAGNTSEFSSAVLIAFGSGGSSEPLAALSPTPAAAHDPLDVNRNGSITAIDALLVINALNAKDAQQAKSADDSGASRDVNGDGRVTALDALVIINRVNENDSPSKGISTVELYDAAFAKWDDDALASEESALEDLLF
ncbi:parallel beta-helix repeat protein [Rhodopirellula rubra]|uniref:Parallel beta-helix repeat protein n=1 Tax=Aporhodopirellula rubra TaxID=980271 RepID=A0A7W5E2C4_9BACT|nr:parallel beta-helix repeat protein [Aporhodopirellula rubra]